MKTKCSSRMKALLLVLAMVLSLFCVSIGTAHPRFTDVPDSFWASKEIAWAVDKGVVNGTSATTFSPNDKTLRGQMTAILYRYAGEPAVSGASSFSDVKSSIYYANAASWAQKNNILISTVSGSNKFLGDTTISRAEFCAMVYNYAGYKSIDRKTTSAAPFSDVKSLSSELRAAINWAYANGIVNGVDKTHFSPDSTLTRAQAVVMLYRYENKFASGGTETNPSTETPAKPDGTTKTYTGADVTAERKSKAVGTLGSYFEVNVPVGQKVYFKVSDSSGKVLGVNIKDCNGFYNHTTDIGFVGIDVDSSSVMVDGYKAGTMVVSLFKSDETNGTLSTVVIRVGGSTCSVAITTPSGISTNPGDTGNQGNQGSKFDYNSVDFNANMDIRNEIVRLTNEVRKENGVAELPTDSAMMNAAQAAAEWYAMKDGMLEHNGGAEAACLELAGVSYSGSTNLLYSPDYSSANVMVNAWKNSNGHFQSMIDSEADNIGVGVAQSPSGRYWAVQFFGDYSSGSSWQSSALSSKMTPGEYLNQALNEK